MAENWSESEVAAAVEDYFSMLWLELTGSSYNKTQHRRALRKHLNNRSDGSVELKHQNISAVLIEMGIPYIDGYKPRSNYQRKLLPSAVTDFLKRNPQFPKLFKQDAEAVPQVPTVADLLQAMEPQPKRERILPEKVAEAPPIYSPADVNYFEREAQNRALGGAGEEFVMNFERARLLYAGKDRLAGGIEQVSETVGPAAGYDIRSFEEDGTDRFIEAKTTKYGKQTPFFVTRNEVEFSRSEADSYYLYRVFKFRAGPRLFAVHGYLEDHFRLMPSQYVGRPR